MVAQAKEYSDYFKPSGPTSRVHCGVNPHDSQGQTIEEASRRKFGEIFPEAEEWMFGSNGH